jgi:hypothetical protein
VKAPITIVLPLAILLSGSLAAYAQQPSAHRHYYGHRRHHHVAHNPARASAPISQRPGETVENGPQTNQMFKPYAHPGEGDSDGLSRDPDDCMKGCIGGNPQ